MGRLSERKPVETVRFSLEREQKRKKRAFQEQRALGIILELENRLEEIAEETFKVTRNRSPTLTKSWKPRLIERSSPERKRISWEGYWRILPWARNGNFGLLTQCNRLHSAGNRLHSASNRLHLLFRVSISRMEKILKLEAVSVELEKLSRTKPNTHRGVDLRKGKVNINDEK
ncbi:hypothetical protein Lal_00015112 [Lupinus albus]|nr:hypothetical protein Lal_00015112 [Lupinus albus]